MDAFENTPQDELSRFIQKYEEKRLDALRSRDGSALRDLLAPGFTFVRQTGEIISREGYINRVVDGRLAYGEEAQFRYQHSYQERELFIVIGLLTRHFEADGEQRAQQLRSSATWYRHEVGWHTLLLVHTAIASDVDVEVPPSPERRIRVQ